MTLGSTTGQPAGETLAIRLLGGLDMRLGDNPVLPLESARAESLLAYLLLHRDTAQSRQRLAFLLWPDSSEPQARTNLRHVLHKLRRALPNPDRFVEVTPRTLRWRPDSPTWLDVAAFEDALERGDLRDAVDRYGGDLLEGSYDEWLLAEREHLRERHLDALSRLTAELERSGEHADAIRYAERLVRDDPLREDAYRALMRLHDARGDRARALRAYHACTAILERELGTTPSAATNEAYRTLLPSREPEPDTAGRAAFVGRAAELALLARLWGRSERGHAQCVLVTGEPGVGKTRLVDELRGWCRRRGATTAEARSYPVEGALAYAPVVAWLRAEPIAARRRRLDRGHLGELARLLPELELPVPPPLPEDEQRRRLFDAISGAILAVTGPLLLVIDDAHWSDRETLRFLHYLIRSHPDAPLLVAATARREEVDDQHPVHELVTGLRALERCVEIELGRLSRDETTALAERLANAPVERPAADRLFAGTEGNPLFVVEAVRAGWGGQDRDAISPRVQAVIEGRLAQLSPPARELAGVAAAVGREFTTDVLAAAAEADEDALHRGLDELWRRRIVRDRGADAYDFTHDRIREVAYRALGPARRRRTHLRLARVLERLGPSDPGAIATHYERAGAGDRAVSWYVDAADAAQRLHAQGDAARALDRALRLLVPHPEGAERDARELALITAALAPLSMAEGFGSRRLHELQRRGLELASPPGPPLLRSLALTALSRGDFGEARGFAGQLRSRAESDGDEVMLVESDYALGVAAFWQGELDAARRHFEAAVARYRPEHRPTHLVRYGIDPKVVCLSRLGNTLWFLGHPEPAVRARDAALALAVEVGHPASTGTAQWFAAMLALELGDADALRACAAALGRAREVKVIETSHDALVGYLDVLDGRPERGLGAIRRALDDVGDSDHAPGHRSCLLRLLVDACALAEEWRAGIEAADLLLETARLWEAEALRMRAQFRAALGESGAADDAERALEVARAQGARSYEARIRGTLAERTAPHPPGP
jgi:DNA-binding SARP family transcriptional activator